MSEQENKTPAEKPAKAKKSKPPVKKEGGLKQWLREMRSELKKVQWPSKKQTGTYTTTVLCCVALVGAFIWAFDYLASNVILALGALVGSI